MKVADVNACVFVNVITNKDVPPALIVDGVKALEMLGRLGVMESGSTAVHVPEVQPAPVFVTPEGTEMDAVLVTCVWAKAFGCTAKRKASIHRPMKTAPVSFNLNKEDFRKLNTFCLLFSKNVTYFE